MTELEQLLPALYHTTPQDKELQRVLLKIRLGVKALLSGAFRYFWFHFFRTGKRSLSTVSVR